MNKVNSQKVYSNFPELGMGIFIVWKRNWLHFRYTLLATLFWVLLEPFFYLVAIGYGLGSYVSNIEGQSFTEFYFPALLGTTAMMVPFFESTYGNFTKLTWQKTYATMLYAPISVDEIFLGELLWATSKGLISILGVTLIAFLFNAFDSIMIFPGILVLLLLAFTFATIGMLFTTIAKNYDSFIYTTSGLIIPFSLFSGTYFPLDQIPIGIRWVAYLSPLTHGVAAVREILNESWSIELAVHILVLILIAGMFLAISRKKFIQKLLN